MASVGNWYRSLVTSEGPGKLQEAIDECTQGWMCAWLRDRPSADESPRGRVIKSYWRLKSWKDHGNRKVRHTNSHAFGVRHAFGNHLTLSRLTSPFSRILLASYSALYNSERRRSPNVIFDESANIYGLRDRSTVAWGLAASVSSTTR